jgi:multiple antibiotic resistance protein
MTSLLQEIVALLAITNPLGAVPVFLAITQTLSPGDRSRLALAALTVIVILCVAALVGKPVLAAFGITMPALQATGELVVLLMGLEMLHGAPSKVQHDQEPLSSLP